MKKLFSLLLGSMAVALCSFTPNKDGDQIKYTVIQHNGMNVEVHDTIVAVNSGYTIEDYIADLGLEADDVEIINIKNESDFVSSDTEIYFINEEMSENGQFNKTVEFKIAEGDVEGMEFEFEELLGEEGHEGQNVFVKKIVMSSDEMQSMEGEEMEKIIEEMKDAHGENIFIEIINENSEGDHMTLTEMEMDVRVEKIIDEKGNEQIQMWINGEEVDPSDHMEMLNPKGSGECEIFIVNDGDSDMAWIGENSFTMAIVSPVSDQPEEKSIPAESNIQDIRFLSNGNNKFTLSFNSIEPAKTEVVIYNIQGKKVFHKKLGDFQGNYSEQLNLSDMAIGTYVLNLIQNGERVVKKIIVQ